MNSDKKEFSPRGDKKRLGEDARGEADTSRQYSVCLTDTTGLVGSAGFSKSAVSIPDVFRDSAHI